MQTGAEPVEAVGNLGPDVDKNWGYEGVLYLTAVLTVKIGSKEPDPKKRIEHFEKCKRYLSRLFGSGKTSRSKPSELLDKTKDLYDKINAMLARMDAGSPTPTRRRRISDRRPVRRYVVHRMAVATRRQDRPGRDRKGDTHTPERGNAGHRLRQDRYGAVHALGQVVHFDTDGDITLQRLCIGMNGILPRDVAVDQRSRRAARFPRAIRGR